MDGIQMLRQRQARDAEALRARRLMTDILEESIARWRLAGFSPALELAECDALVLVRLDSRVWALRQVGPVVQADAVGLRDNPVSPAPVVDAAPIAAGAPVDTAVTDHSWVWTPERDAILLQRRAEGFTARQIADELGTSKHSVEQRMNRMRKTGVDVPPAANVTLIWTAERDARLIELRAAGHTADQIAVELGTTNKAIGNRVAKLRAMGREMPEATRAPREMFATPTVRVDGAVLRAWTDQDDAALVSGYSAGRKLVDMARDLDRSFSAVNSRLRHLRETGGINHRRCVAPGENPWPAAQKQALRDLWPVMRVADIAARLGLSTGSVSGMAHRMGLGPAYRAPAEQKSEPEAVVPEAAPVVVPEAAPVVVIEPAPVPQPAPVTGPSAGFVSAAARPMTVNRVAVRLSGDMTAAARAAEVAAHVQQLAADANFDAEADLELCEAVFGGRAGLQLFATDFGLDIKVALARFDMIVRPFRRPGEKALPIDTAGLLLPALRERVKAARGVAA